MAMDISSCVDSIFFWETFIYRWFSHCHVWLPEGIFQSHRWPKHPTSKKRKVETLTLLRSCGEDAGSAGPGAEMGWSKCFFPTNSIEKNQDEPYQILEYHIFRQIQMVKHVQIEKILWFCCNGCGKRLHVNVSHAANWWSHHLFQLSSLA